ncbi:unnamed protein product [Rotaria magnacalcarata]|uniref:Uncharacterized protein n=1 Tax=Rotaria magnacalcarata TaxID=392030 RepID=A0A8S3HC26_9BILA|nr:unnamed protein product [Rotaria magnacalcarata]
MNNTASTSIILPVALAVVHELGIYSENSLNRQQAAVINGRFLLAVVYSSSIGVLSSLVGTAPNVYLKGFVEVNSKYGGTGFRIKFLNFLLFALPVGILILILCWF